MELLFTDLKIIPYSGFSIKILDQANSFLLLRVKLYISYHFFAVMGLCKSLFVNFVSCFYLLKCIVFFFFIFKRLLWKEELRGFDFFFEEPNHEGRGVNSCLRNNFWKSLSHTRGERWKKKKNQWNKARLYSKFLQYYSFQNIGLLKQINDTFFLKKKTLYLHVIFIIMYQNKLSILQFNATYYSFHSYL